MLERLATSERAKGAWPFPAEVPFDFIGRDGSAIDWSLSTSAIVASLIAALE
jgi:hypothetical protein